MKCFIVGIKKGERRAVFAALCGSETKAARKVLGRNMGWEVEFVKPKQEATVFRIYDDDWYEDEPPLNQPFERVPQHAGDPGYGPVPPESNVVDIRSNEPAMHEPQEGQGK